jgi:hypothetical protein
MFVDHRPRIRLLSGWKRPERGRTLEDAAFPTPCPPGRIRLQL